MIIFTLHIEFHRMARPCRAAYDNRAGCHTQLDALTAATEDAERCIALERTWGPGYRRKGHVQLRTKDYQGVRPC